MSVGHDLETPSAWIEQWAPLIRPGGAVLDVACGSGRHARFLARLGFEVTGVDRDVSLFRDGTPSILAVDGTPSILAVDGTPSILAVDIPPGVELVEADIEAGPWPFAGRRFDGVVVTNYLHRPLLPILVDSLEPGGVFIYETFAQGNERFGKPSNPAFLLAPGELLEAVRGRLRVVAYEDRVVEDPRPAAIQRVCARLS